MRFSFLAAIVLCLFSLPGFSEESYAVLNITSSQLNEKDLASFSDFLTTAVTETSPTAKVYGWNDIVAMLAHTAQKQALGCDDEKCLAAIGGELGVNYLIAGTLGKMGEKYMLTLKIIDIEKAQTKARASKSVDGDIGKLLDEMPGVVQGLMGLKLSGASGGGSSSVSVSRKSSSVGVMPIEMVSIPGGTFQMGSNILKNEQPIHNVIVSSFMMGTTEVTQGQYKAVMGKNPSKFIGDDNRPVESVSWKDAVAFCNALSIKEGRKPSYNGIICDFKANGYRLPTEAEWEYACRGGSTEEYYWGADASKATIGSNAWFLYNSEGTTHPVGEKTKNIFGLYDITGNVSEWCNDKYGEYRGADVTDPVGAETSPYRVSRGGSWNVNSHNIRSANRNIYDSRGGKSIGFRVVFRR